MNELREDQIIIDWFHSDDEAVPFAPMRPRLLPFMGIPAMRAEDV